MRIDVLKDRLRLTSILDKALHGVGDESVGEHIGDVVKVLGNNVGGATKIELSQLARLIGKKDSHTVMNMILCTAYMHEFLAFWDISKEDSSTGTWNRIPGAITDQRFLISNQTNTGTFFLSQRNFVPVQHIQRRVCGEWGGENQPILTSCPHLKKIGQVLYCPTKNYNKYRSTR